MSGFNRFLCPYSVDSTSSRTTLKYLTQPQYCSLTLNIVERRNINKRAMMTGIVWVCSEEIRKLVDCRHYKKSNDAGKGRMEVRTTKWRLEIFYAK